LLAFADGTLLFLAATASLGRGLNNCPFVSFITDSKSRVSLAVVPDWGAFSPMADSVDLQPLKNSERMPI